jgi:hypothetical protein
MQERLSIALVEFAVAIAMGGCFLRRQDSGLRGTSRIKSGTIEFLRGGKN